MNFIQVWWYENKLKRLGWHVWDYAAPRGKPAYRYTYYTHPNIPGGACDLKRALEQSEIHLKPKGGKP